MRRHAVRPVALLLLLAAAGCRPSQPIPVGFVAGLTGRHYDLGISSRNGATLAVEELNAAGGVEGRPLELRVRDDRQDPQAAREAVTGLIGEGVVAIVGHVTSTMAVETLPIADREHVLMLSPTVSSAALAGRDDWLVTLHPSTAVAAHAVAAWLSAHRPVHRVAAIIDLSNRAFSESWRDQFAGQLQEHGGELIRSIAFTSGEGVMLRTPVAEALDAQPDAVLVIANALDTAALCQLIRRRSADVLILGSDWGFTQDVIAHGGQAVEGAIFTQRIDLEAREPDLVRFRQAYVARFGRPADFAAAQSYEAVQMLARALRRDPTREGVRRAILQANDYAGLRGDLRIDATGDAQRRQLISTIRGGRIMVLE
ncbi:MAG: ABC transporter substrate-binding protein [Anaeromyxobacter sp.]